MEELKNSTDAITIINAMGTVLFWNSGATDLFGFESNEMVGEKLTKIMPERHQKEHIHAVKEWTPKSPRFCVLDGEKGLFGKKKDGTEFPVKIYSLEFQFNGQPHFLGIMRNTFVEEAVIGEMSLLSKKMKSIIDE